uniref:NUP160 C-terminal TPR domain-containing protein n=1 Tax=Kalanchoe fedtschenkoi TaxID=63787 RepID=A0A7N0SZS4_KALFE
MSAEYLLSLSNASWTPSGHDELPSDLVDLLVETDLYDMAFTVVLKFWRNMNLKRELERVFHSLSIKCCPKEAGPSAVRDNSRVNGHLLIASKDYMAFDRAPDFAPSGQKSEVNSQWDVLKTYLENYISYNARLPVIVAQTILQADPQIELPVWLVHMFKVDKKEKKWGMAGQESSPAMLFQIYVACGRYTEATNLLLEYIESCAATRPSDIIHRKKASAIWFPYTKIQHLCFQLDQMIKSGRMVDQCNKLKGRIYTALEKHLKMVKVDSEDAVASALPQDTNVDVMHGY